MAKANHEQAPAGKPERAPRDNRRIVQGVEFPKLVTTHEGLLIYPDGGGVDTFADNTPEGLNALEARMTADQCAYLKEQGAIDGDWSPSGKPLPLMPGSKADLALQQKATEKAKTELEQLRATNQMLQAQLADKPKK